LNTVLKRSWLKSIFAVFVIALALFILAACEEDIQGKTDAEILAMAKEQVQIAYQTGDTSVSVTKNITLPGSLTVEGKQVTITWASSNEDIIEIDGSTGKVTRPANANVEVTLTATVTLGEATDDIEFKVTVIKAEVSPQEALQALTLTGATYNSTTDFWTTSGNLTLATTSMGLTVTWTSANTDLIKNDGTVTRPAWDSSDQLVQLTATINGVSRTFKVIVLKIDVKPVSAKLQEAYNALLIPGVTDGVAADLNLPATVGQEGVKVSWKSSNPDVLSDEGVVFYPEEITIVTMTATLYIDGEEETMTKEFELTVMVGVEPVFTGSIAELNEWGKTVTLGDNNFVKVEGVTIVGRTKDGFLVADETGILFVYTQSSPDATRFPVGRVIDLYGVYDVYFGAPQLKSVVGKAVRGATSDAPETVLEPRVIEDLNAYIADLISNETNASNPYGQTNQLVMEYIQLTVKVRVQGAGNYDTVLVAPDYNGGNIDTSGALENVTNNALMIYYQSNMSDVKLFDGLVVTFNVFMYARRTNNDIYAVVFTGTADDIEPVATNAEIIDIVGSAISSQVAPEYPAVTALSLPTALLGATITYESSNTNLLSIAANGTVTMTMPEVQTEVTITAIVTRDGVDKEFEIKTKLGELPIVDIKDARDGFDSNGSVRVVGSVNAMYNARYFIIQDETGTIPLYIGDAKSPWYTPSSPTATTVAGMNAFWTAFGGKKVDLEGIYGTFNGNIYIIPTKITDKGAATTYPPVDITDVPLTKDGLAPYLSNFVSVSNLEIIDKPAQSFGNIMFKLKDSEGYEINLFWDSRSLQFGGNTVESITTFLNSFEIGSFIDLVGVTVNMASTDVVRFELNSINNVKVHVDEPDTDEGRVQSAAQNLNIPDQTAASSIVLPATGLWGTAITWESSHPAILNAETGAITLPAGPAVEVTLTATIKLNAVEEEFEYVVLVGYPTLTLAQAVAVAKGEKLATQGVVTSFSVAENGQVVAFIQDENTGFYAYKVPAADASKIAVGNLVHFVGDKDIFNNLHQVRNITAVTLISSDNEFEPVVLTNPEQNAANLGKLVSVTGYLRETPPANASDFYLVTEYGQFAIRLVSGSDSVPATRTAAQNALLGAVAGQEITIVGGLSIYNANWQIMLFNVDQLTIGDVASDEDLADILLANLVLPEENAEVTANLTLPTTGMFGLTVVWSSSDTEVIANNGTVVRPEEDTPVTLTVSIKKGEAVIKAVEIDVTVKGTGGGDPEPQPVTVNMQWTATSSNMDETTNYAETLGLNPDIFTVKAVKGSASTIVGIYTDLRIYGNRADGNGNSLVITIAAGYKITSITYKFGASTNNAIGTLTFDSGTPINLAIADVLNVTKTYSDLSASVVTLKNTHTGGSSNGQIRIDGISITYVPVTE
jgi:hypothetical protein